MIYSGSFSDHLVSSHEPKPFSLTYKIKLSDSYILKLFDWINERMYFIIFFGLDTGTAYLLIGWYDLKILKNQSNFN